MRENVAISLVRPLRRSVKIPCQVVRERGFSLVGRHMLDLSTEGMLVRDDVADRRSSRDRVLTGDPVLVTFLAPFSQRWIDAEAIVARVIHGRRTYDRGRAFGIVFEHIDSEARRQLQRELDWFAPMRPRH